MSKIIKTSKLIIIAILLIILGTRYIYLVNEDNGINKVLVTYVSDFETANVLNSITDAVINVEDGLTVVKVSKEEEEKQKQEEEKKKQDEEQKKKEEAEKLVAEKKQQQASAPHDTTIDAGAASDVVNYAMQFVGNPYVYGGNSLTNGTDCSGFTSLVFAHFGITIPRSSGDQVNAGRAVSIDSIQPGDLVLQGYNGRIHHAAIYIGNGQIVHALNQKTGIVVTSIDIMPTHAVRRVL